MYVFHSYTTRLASLWEANFPLRHSNLGDGYIELENVSMWLGKGSLQQFIITVKPVVKTTSIRKLSV